MKTLKEIKSKKLICLFTIIILMSSFTYLDSIYSFSIRTIDGNKIDLSSFKGKKIMFIIIPLNDKDSLIKDLQVFEKGNQGNLIVVGVPSMEEGFKKGDEKHIQYMYQQNSKINMIIMEGIKVKKTSHEEQSELFQWLTDKNKNKRFNQDVLGIGHKYFIDEEGKLYASIGPQIPLSAPIMNQIAHRPLIKK